MVSEVLKKEIEHYYAHMRQTNPLFQNAKNGTLTAQSMNRYLAGILFLIRHTPVHLRLAKMRAKELGQDRIADFYASKLHEEEGHDQWARADIAKMRALSPVPEHLKGPNVPPPIMDLVSYIEEQIRNDPPRYLAYIFLAEYFTVLAGPEWLADLESHCGIPKTFMSVIGNHVDLDQAHVLDDIKEIDKYLDDSKVAAATKVLKGAMNFHEAFCTDVGKH